MTRINRRTVLLGLGAAGLGSGGLFASGAFTSVEAERTVELDTSDDSSAILSFEPNNPSSFADNNIVGSEDNSGSTLIKIEQSDLNENAVTRFDETLKVTNNGEKNVGLSVNSGASSDDGNLESVLDIQESGSTIVDSPVDLNAGNELTLDIKVDLRNGSGDDLGNIDNIVFVADQNDHSSA